MKKIYFLGYILMTINAFSQINSPNGSNLFYYNGSADVTFRFQPRGTGGRAFVHADGNVLGLNFGNDFTGGTRIGNDVFFKDGGNSYINSGNFGIGTYSPTAKLDVRGNILVWGSNSGNAEEHGQILFENTNHGIRRIGNVVDIFTSGGTESGITFTPRSFNATTNSYSNMLVALKIASDGKIGIGTTNPTKKLDIYSGFETAFKISTADPSLYATEIHLGGSADFTKSAIISAPNPAGWYRQDLFFCLANGNDTSSVGISDAAMVIKSYNSGKFGNVGIGTTNPTKKLDIYSGFETAFKISTADPSLYATEIHLGGSADFTKSAIISAPNPAGWYRQDLFFCLANGNDTSSVGISDAAMVIKSYNSGKFGNVGIGTTNPDEKLTVNGKIHAQEVRIDLSSPMTVPDYVFANDYKLKSLAEIEAYIKQNNHLPEIPSAKEIEKNGLMLAEMNMSLLKKIEELTLYSIDQNKKMEAQAKEIEALKDLVIRVTKIETELARK